MAVKSKTRRNKKKKQGLDQEFYIYIHGLILITLSCIGCLQIGFVGEMMTGIIRYFFGNLYGIIYGIIIFYSILLMFRKSITEFPMKYIVGTLCFLIAWLLLASLPTDHSLSGMDIFSNYISNTIAILREEKQVGGGCIGALLVSISTFLFDEMGTKIIVVALFVLGGLLFGSKVIFVYLYKQIGVVRSMKLPKKKKVTRKIEKVRSHQKVEDYKEDDTSIEDRIRPGQVSFLDIDEEAHEVVEQTNTKKVSFLDVDKTQPIPTVKAQDQKVETVEVNADQFVSSFHEDYTNYQLPSINLLKDVGKKNRSRANVDAANEAGRRLIEILDQFHVKATLVATHIGPAVTKFELKPDLGVRVNKISNLQYDIKMALAAKDIRIEAPIPGKSAVGIEIPNAEKTMVGMKELLYQVPEQYTSKKLLFALGKDLMGNCVYGELNKMPHLLIAGATGSGKSVCVNSIITSILMRAKPDEVKLLLVDPKKVEFTPYKTIPHLLGPVITDGEEANRALKVIVAMMDQRYELFAKVGVRNISGYNAYLQEHREEQLQPLPWIVVIIDELADLMLVAAKEVEASIQRITQLARAAGIHLIVATQRPSVDVITGVIKANIPSRIAFAVSSAVDSRTILDQVGAEKLLGYGDMLYIPVGETNAVRVQGVFVSDEEVQAICDAASMQGKPKYEDAFLRLEALDQSTSFQEDTNDPLYDEVKSFIINTKKASTSLIQRKFSIGYARAARLIDILEERGIIGPARGSKPREVLVKYEETVEHE